MAATPSGSEIVNVTYNVGVAGVQNLSITGRAALKMGADLMLAGKAVEAFTVSQERLQRLFALKGGLSSQYKTTGDAFDALSLSTRQSRKEYNAWSKSVEGISKSTSKPTINALDDLIIRGDKLSSTLTNKKGIPKAVAELRNLRGEIITNAASAKVTVKSLEVTEDALSRKAAAFTEADKVAEKLNKREFSRLKEDIVLRSKVTNKTTKDVMGLAKTELRFEKQKQGEIKETTRLEERQVALEERRAKEEMKLARRGPMQRATLQETRNFEKLQMAAQSALLGMSAYSTVTDIASGNTKALKGDILGLGLSLIFLRFAFDNMTKGLLAGGAVFGLALVGDWLLNIIGSIQKIGEFKTSMTNLGLSMESAAEATKDIDTVSKRWREELGKLVDGKESIDHVREAAGLLVANGLKPTEEQLDALARTAIATQRPMADIAKAFLTVTRPSDMMIGSYQELRTALVGLIGVTRLPEQDEFLKFFGEMKRIVGTPFDTLEAAAVRAARLQTLLEETFGVAGLEKLVAIGPEGPITSAKKNFTPAGTVFDSSLYTPESLGRSAEILRTGGFRSLLEQISLDTGKSISDSITEAVERQRAVLGSSQGESLSITTTTEVTLSRFSDVSNHGHIYGDDF